MRFKLISLPFILAAGLAAQPLDSRLLSLIPGDAWFVAAVDVERYRESNLNTPDGFAVDAHPFGLNAGAARQLRQIIVTEGGLPDRRASLTILRGAIGAAPHTLGPEEAFVVLDNETTVYGGPAAVDQAVKRFTRPANLNAELGAKLARMSESFDNWFIAIRPIENAAEPTASSAPLKHRAEFMHLVREVRGGIRLGGINQVQVEVEMNNAEDAAGLVAIGRWLPGLLQMRGGDWEAALVELAENLCVWQNGSTASLSFTLDENKVKELVKSRQALEQGSGGPVIIE